MIPSVYASPAPHPVSPSGQPLLTPHALRFGQQDAEKSSAQEPPPEKPGLFKWIKSLLGSLEQPGLVTGLKQSGNVLKNLPVWNELLAQANPESTVVERLLAILDLAYAGLRGGLTSRNQSADASPAVTTEQALTHRLYTSVFQRFPSLIAQQDPQVKTIIEQAIATSPFPDTARITITRLQAFHDKATGMADPGERSEEIQLIQKEIAQFFSS